MIEVGAEDNVDNYYVCRNTACPNRSEHILGSTVHLRKDCTCEDCGTVMSVVPVNPSGKTAQDKVFRVNTAIKKSRKPNAKKKNSVTRKKAYKI